MCLTTSTSIGTYSLRGGSGIYGTMYRYSIPYTTQNHTLIIFKLLIKLYTTVLLLSTIANLQVPDNSFSSLRMHFKEHHGILGHKLFPPVLNIHYNIQMIATTYKMFFLYDTCVELKPDAFDILNEFYWKHIQIKLSHGLGS